MNVSTADLAKILRITPRRVGQLTDEGKIPKVARNLYELEAAIPAYVAFRVAEASEEAGELDKARIRQVNAKADQEEIKAARLKGTVHDGKVVEAIIGGIISNAKTKVLALENKLAGSVQSVLPLPEVAAIIHEHCAETLTELAAFDVRQLVEEFVAQHRDELSDGGPSDDEETDEASPG